MDTKIRILIVDGDKKIASSLEEAVTRYDKSCQCVKLVNAEESMLRLGEGFDCAVINYELPTISGLSLCEYIKAKSFGFPVILYTRKAREDVGLAAVKLGIDEYIPRIKDTYDFFPYIVFNIIYRRAYTEYAVNTRFLKDALFTASEMMGSDIPTDAILNQSLKLTADLLKAEGGSLMILDREAQELVIRSVVGNTKSSLIGTRLKMGERISGRAAEMEEAILIDGSINQDDRFKDMAKYEEIESSMSVPVMCKGRLVGIINLKRVSQKSKFSADDIKIATVFAQSAAYIIENDDYYSKYCISKDYLNGIIGGMNDLLMVIDSSGTIRTVNDRFLFETGFDINYCLDRQAGELLFNPQEQNFLGEQYLSGVISAGSDIIEKAGFRSGKAAGSLFSVNICPIKIQGCQPAKTIEDCEIFNKESRHDCASSKILGIALLMKKEDDSSLLEERLRRVIREASLGEIASCVAFEVSEPVEKVRSVIDSLVSKVSEDNPSYKILSQLRTDIDSSGEALKIFAGIMDSGNTVDKIIYPVNIIDGVLKLFSRQFSKKGISVEKIYHSADPVSFRELELALCIITLLNNSRDSMPQGGRITIQVENRSEKDSKKLLISVSDDGAGITESEKPRVFTPFYSTKKVSSGLALYNLKETVSRAGGEAGFESVPGKLTKFYIELPAAE